MVYSHTLHPNAPYEFPAPPLYLVWIQEIKWDSKSRTQVHIDEGQVRHMSDLSKAKARIRSYAKPGWRADSQDAFHVDWAIYLWDQDKGEYALQYDGKRGEAIARNPLFTTRIQKDSKTPRPGLDDEVQTAIQSIVKAGDVG